MVRTDVDVLDAIPMIPVLFLVVVHIGGHSYAELRRIWRQFKERVVRLPSRKVWKVVREVLYACFLSLPPLSYVSLYLINLSMICHLCVMAAVHSSTA